MPAIEFVVKAVGVGTSALGRLPEGTPVPAAAGASDSSAEPPAEARITLADPLTAPDGYYDFADRNVMVVTVVEDTAALANIDEIAATPGIDVIFIGTSDLSFSLGLRGKQDHPRLKHAIARIIAAGLRHGKMLGRPAGTLEQIRQYQKEGFLFFQTRTETEFMAAGAEQLLKPLGKKRQFASGGGI